MLACEWGVGYEGIFCDHRAFESHAWRQYIYGKRGLINGHWYDTTIPNFFNPDDFATGRKKGYLVFLGRIVQRKGVEVAVQIAERAGLTLKIAGQGGEVIEPGIVKSNEVTLMSDYIDYVGPVGVEERKALLSGAVACVMPTYYIEPFGGVAVEAMLSGTPVIASDWGAFTETVQPGISGERFATLREGVEAVEKVKAIKPAALRKWATSRYSLEAVGPQYDRWFRQLQGLWGVGWDA
jgi:glycosyltransferase involved in cell wall biosynthesis